VKEEELVVLAKKLLVIISACHKAGIFHGNINLKNILIRKSEKIDSLLL